MRQRLVAVIFALSLAVSPAIAFGGTAWYDGSDPGDNYSWDLFFDDTTLRVHDGECDGDNAYANYYSTAAMGTERRIDDPDGCSTEEATSSTITYLYRHRTCEDHQFSPDPCSGYNFE